MDEITFWYLIGQSLEQAQDEVDGDDDFSSVSGGARESGALLDLQLSCLKKLLTPLSEDEIVGFQEIVDYLMDQAYTWGLWGAAYLMLGGCSDDDFEYFRAGLILRGKEVYEEALKDPDSLGGVPEIVVCEDLLYLACEVYEERSGDGAIYERFREIINVEPAGDPFDEDDESYFKEHYPRLWERYSQE